MPQESLRRLGLEWGAWVVGGSRGLDGPLTVPGHGSLCTGTVGLLKRQLGAERAPARRFEGACVSPWPGCWRRERDFSGCQPTRLVAPALLRAALAAAPAPRLGSLARPDEHFDLSDASLLRKCAIVRAPASPRPPACTSASLPVHCHPACPRRRRRCCYCSFPFHHRSPVSAS